MTVTITYGFEVRNRSLSSTVAEIMRDACSIVIRRTAMKHVRRLTVAAAVAAVMAVFMSASPHADTNGVSRDIALAGISSPQTGDFTPSGDGGLGPEFSPLEGADSDAGDDGAGAALVNRSFVRGVGQGVGVSSAKRAKSNPEVIGTFDGLNFYQQRYARGGNQFSIDPPDQGLCVGNGYAIEVVNDVVNVFNASGESVLPDNTATNIVSGFPRNVNHAIDLNSFYGYPAAINRTTGVFGPELTDPSCLYDAQTGRFFMVVLTLDSLANGTLTGKNHLDIAVSQTSNPTGPWQIYKVPVQNDGTDGTPNHHCPGGACLGDYPHIGADAYGFYMTTNEFAFFANGFTGAQIYALSKAQLAAGASTVTMTQFDTSVTTGPQNFPGFTVWPAQSPGTSSFELDNGGTEYFLSSDAVFSVTGTSTEVVQWTLTNTSSLVTGPLGVSLKSKAITVTQYAVPPNATQLGSGGAPDLSIPQGHCLNDTTTVTVAGVGCWHLLVNATAHARGPEVVTKLPANDSRMQQVTFANGKLWGALDTAVTVNGQNRAGIAWYVINPSAGGGPSSRTPILQGIVGVAGTDLTYPAIGVNASGRGVVAFTLTGDTDNPSAAYASIDALAGFGAVHVIAAGAAASDTFTGYRQQLSPRRPRWGDYGAAAVDGNTIWIASEYIPNACDYADWGGPFFVGGTGDNLLGTCGGANHGPGARAALGNWGTRITALTVQ